ncbi:MAG: GNAT family N-acetyltransferase [Paludibacteraceae bacterium]|nr:GNAT family N-acetyltransferase [Paludibacteraceae bacterium]
MTVIKDTKEKLLTNQAIQSLKESQGVQKIGLLIAKSQSHFKHDEYWKMKTASIKERTTYLSFYLNPKAYPVQPIALRKPQFFLEKEVRSLEKDCLLFTLKEFSVYCAPGNRIPNLLHEIGRLREITFREVGEGTLNSLDIDRFDQYYRQLFIWDNNQKKLVGGYRIGMGGDIMRQQGSDGFYLQTLFRMNPYADELLGQSMEMGRSFIVSEYQRKPLSLFMLWKGILMFLLENSDYRYLIGPVSISDRFSPLSQQLIMSLIRRQHNHYVYSQYICPKNPFQENYAKDYIDSILKDIPDLQGLDEYIMKTEGKRVPVLIKKYVQLGAKIAGFNVDPQFNNSLDGFLILDLMAVPREMLQSLSKDVDKNIVSNRFMSRS